MEALKDASPRGITKALEECHFERNDCQYKLEHLKLSRSSLICHALHTNSSHNIIALTKDVDIMHYMRHIWEGFWLKEPDQSETRARPSHNDKYHNEEVREHQDISTACAIHGSSNKEDDGSEQCHTHMI